MFACRAAETLREMSDSGIKPGVVTYTTLLNAYGAAEDVIMAHQVLRDMPAAGVQPNNVTYTSLMGHYSRLGDVAKVKVLPVFCCVFSSLLNHYTVICNISTKSRCFLPFVVK